MSADTRSQTSSAKEITPSWVRTPEEVEYLVKQILLNREHVHPGQVEDLSVLLKRKYPFAGEQLVECGETVLIHLLQCAAELPGVENRLAIIRGSEPKSKAHESIIGPNMGRLLTLQTKAIRQSVPHMNGKFKPQSWRRTVGSFERNSDIDMMIRLRPEYSGLSEIREQLGFTQEVAKTGSGLYQYIGPQFEGFNVFWQEPTVSNSSVKHIYIEIYSKYGQVITYDILLLPEDPSFFTNLIREGLPASNHDLFVTADLIQVSSSGGAKNKFAVQHYKESTNIMAQIDRPFVPAQNISVNIAEYVRQCYMRMLFPMEYDRPGSMYEMFCAEGVENPIAIAMEFISAVITELLIKEMVTLDPKTQKLVLKRPLSIEEKLALVDKRVLKLVRGFPQSIIAALLENPFELPSTTLQEKILVLANPFLDIKNRVTEHLAAKRQIDTRQSDILKDSLRMVTADPFSGLRILFHTGIAEFSGLGQLIRRCGGIENVVTHFTIILNGGQKTQLTPEGYHQLILRDAITLVENTGPSIVARAIQDIVHETMPKATFGPIALYAWDLFTVDPVRMIS